MPLSFSQKIFLLLGIFISIAIISAMVHNSHQNILNLSYEEFDQAPQGWRLLAEKKEHCTAAELIQAYITLHQHELSDNQLANLYFHSSQLYAWIEDKRAYLSIEKSLCYANVTYESMSTNDQSLFEWWPLYVKATQAFLKKDKVEFNIIKDRFLARYPDHFNKPVIDRLAEHFDLPYAKAYGRS